MFSQVKEQEQHLDKDASSRSTLNPSASFYVRNRSDRPSYMPMRSASMRETSYSRSIRRRGQRVSAVTREGSDTLSVTNEITAMGNGGADGCPPTLVAPSVVVIDEVPNGHE